MLAAGRVRITSTARPIARRAAAGRPMAAAAPQYDIAVKGYQPGDVLGDCECAGTVGGGGANITLGTASSTASS